MRKYLFLLIIFCIGLQANAHIYNNFMEAGKYAKTDMNYPLASYFYEEALSLIPQDSIVDIYIVNANLRDVNKKLGQYDKAIHNGRKCLDILKNLGQGVKTDLMEDYIIFADILTCQREYLKAECYLDSALQIVSLPGIHMAYKKKFSTLAGIIYSHINKWAMAESAFDLAVKISQKFRESDDTQTTLNLYGNSLFHNNKYEEALKTYEKQRDVCDRLFGKNSREYQWANYCIANMLAYLGRIGEGSATYREAIGWYKNKILNDLQSIPSTEREKYLDNMIELLQNAISFGIEAKYNEDEFTGLAYNSLLLTKGLLLATEKSTESIIRENGTSNEIAALTTLKQLKTDLANLLVNPDSNPKDVLNTYAKIKTIDVQLANACARYGNNTSFAAIGYKEVKNSLRDDEILLDFADFKPQSKSRQYVCYEIRKNQKYPKVHYVCNGAQIDSLLTLEKHNWGNLYSGEAAADMTSIIGKPLKQIIGDAKTVYYVPSGIFHKLVIEAIPDGGNRLGDNHSFHRLSSAREVATDDKGKTKGSAQLYGGLTYGSDIKGLPHSLQEVNGISKVISPDIVSVTLSGNDGTKASFTELSNSAPDIIHFSTHGFFYTPTDRNVPSSLQGYNDAMYLSGLVMSGGSLTSRQGLLTADEVSHCNLTNTSIACLASCHSGQGEVTAEGIYGLQRAFKKAGVKTVIMNLWEASDVATQYFMTNFYSDLINGSKDRHKAFQYARDEVRKKYQSPFYWAGFVMVD